MIETQDIFAILAILAAAALIGGTAILINRLAHRRKTTKTENQQPEPRPRRKGPGFYLSEIARFIGLGHLSPLVGNTLILVILALWTPLFGSIFWGLLQMIWSLPEMARLARAPSSDTLPMRYTLLGITALSAALGATVAFPFTVLRTRYNARQTDAAEQGLITDRINKAVEGLGAQKEINGFRRRVEIIEDPVHDDDDPKRTVKFEWRTTAAWDEIIEPMPGPMPFTVKTGDWESATRTDPNIEVRIGAIYALERIAKDSERDHIQIMEILCAYIRQNAPTTDAQPNPTGDWPEYPEEADKDALKTYNEAVKAYRQKLDLWIKTLKRDHKPRPDIQTALSVLGRRDPARIDGVEAKDYRGTDRYRLDLRNTNLQAADLAHLDLRFAQLTEAKMQGAVLREAEMQGAVLKWAEMQGAVLREAEMQGADLKWAEMQGADLSGAKMQRAFLSGAKMQRAVLSWAEMQGAVLSWAEMQGAVLYGAKMQRAVLSSAKMQGADLREAKMQRADLREAKMQGAVLSGAEMQRADLRGAEMQRADLRGAEMQRADLREAVLRSANWAGLNIDSAPAQFADLRDATDLTQDHLSSLVGNAATLLPDDPALFIPDRWATEPPHWNLLIETAKRTGDSEDRLRRRHLCAPGQVPQRTGTPWPADRPPPWEEEGISRDVWVENQPTRGPVDPTG